MASVLDVAQYILQKQGVMSVMKLQKLVYYCQAWSLVWDEKPLFSENIEAWANGPVVRRLYDAHKGKFEISSLIKGDSDNLTPAQRETIDAVLGCYGDKTAQWLGDLTHLEAPWNIAREGIPPGRGCDNVISHACMHEYYSSLPPD
jgi:uncharacterized phage-associated protein